jgi:predicted transcriptional regulator
MSKLLQVELPDEVYTALEEAARARGATLETEAAERLRKDLRTREEREAAIDRALMEAGLMLKPPTGLVRGTRFKTLPVKGKPVSETIIEGRR